MISAVVLTKNEEKNLSDCLESVKWCDEIVIVDDNSTDKTLEIAKKFDAKVFNHSLDNDFAAQRNFGLEKAQGDWIFFVDADERVTPELKDEIKKQLIFATSSGYFLKRNDFYGERWLKYGETSKTRLLRLAKKNSGKWIRTVHEVWQVKGKTGEFINPLLHYPHSTVSEFLSSINAYSSSHAKVLKENGVKPSLSRIIFNPLAKFVQNYFFRLGFLDGMPGAVVAFMMSFHSFLARAKLYFLWKK